MTGGTWRRSENVAFDAVSCATVPVLSEGGPAKWLKNKNLQNHLCDYEPGGREFESLRAHQIFFVDQIISGPDCAQTVPRLCLVDLSVCDEHHRNMQDFIFICRIPSQIFGVGDVPGLSIP
jgi:hypothetical protein